MNNKYLDKIENALIDALKNIKGLTDDTLYSAMHYALMNGGKRVRPTLMLMSANMLGVKYDRVLPLCVAIEFIHTYSLIHDDLPAMDNDDYRRGQLTVHKIYGEAVAVLAGDAFLNLAYEVLIDNILIDSLSADSAKLIARCAGVSGMVGGQSLEFSFGSVSDTITSEDKVKKIFNIYKKKTGALISASIYAPFLLLPYQDANVGKILWKVAENTGVIFQLVDDLIDHEAGEDIDKPTAINILGINKIKDLIAEKDQENKKLLLQIGQESNEFLEYFAYLSHRIT